MNGYVCVLFQCYLVKEINSNINQAHVDTVTELNLPMFFVCFFQCYLVKEINSKYESAHVDTVTELNLPMFFVCFFSVTW